MSALAFRDESCWELTKAAVSYRILYNERAAD